MSGLPGSASKANIYSRGQETNHWPFSEAASAILNAKPELITSPSSVLEKGCGIGNNLRFLADGDFRAEVFYISATAAAIAKKMLSDDGHAGVDLRISEPLHCPRLINPLISCSNVEHWSTIHRSRSTGRCLKRKFFPLG